MLFLKFILPSERIPVHRRKIRFDSTYYTITSKVTMKCL